MFHIATRFMKKMHATKSNYVEFIRILFCEITTHDLTFFDDTEVKRIFLNLTR